MIFATFDQMYVSLLNKITVPPIPPFKKNIKPLKSILHTLFFVG